jgi:hypothetical protein
MSSPIFADLDGNGRDELITAVSGGRLMAFRTDDRGQISLFQVYNTGSQANFKATPVVLDAPGIGKVIVAALGRDESREYDLEDGRVFAFNAVTGAVLPGWPKDTDRPPPDSRHSSGVTGGLATGDLDGDGVPEVVVTSFSQMVSAFKLDGTKIWTYANDETVEPGAVIADLDRDGKNEVIYASGISPSPYYPAGGMITILNGDGSLKRRIFTGEVFFASPIVADLNRDGFLEIIAATGPYWNTHHSDPALQARARAEGNRIYAFDHLGNVVPGWPFHTTSNDALDRQTWKEPVAADLDGDLRPEILAIDRAGILHVVTPDGREFRGFQGGKVINPVISGQPALDAFTTPIVADVNGDGKQDVIASHAWQIRIYDNSGAEIFSAHTPTPPGTGIPEGLANAPAVGQFDGRGGLELAFLSLSTVGSQPPRSVTIYNLPASTAAPAWPMHRRDAAGRAILHDLGYLGSYVEHAYRAILGRNATGPEISGAALALLSNRANLFDIARFLSYGQEGQARWGGLLTGSEGEVAARLAPVYAAAFGSAAIPPDASAAATFDSHRGLPAAEVVARVVGSNGNYASTNLYGGWVRSLYRDIFGRQASPGEVALVLRVFDTNTVTPGQFVQFLMNSPEGRQVYVASQVRKYLGREPSAQDLNRYLGYARREDVVVAIVTGDEYLRRNGGSVEGLVRGMYRDILGLAQPPARDVANWVSQIQGSPRRRGRPRATPATLASSLVSGQFYRETFVIDQLFKLAPLLSRGVLRLPLGLTGAPINPDPNVLNSYTNLLNVGARQEDILSLLYTALPYYTSSSYNRGIYVSPNIRL